MPRQFFRSLIPHFDARWATIRLHIIPFACIVGGIFAFYFASRIIAPGWVTYILSTVALVLLGLTALARLNDIPHTNTAIRWQMRRGGLILVGAACLSLIFAPWVSPLPGDLTDWPSWREVMFRIGVLLVWMTTPLMPPWHRYMSGEFRKVIVEVPENTQVSVVRTETIEGGGMFQERRSKQIHEEGP